MKWSEVRTSRQREKLVDESLVELKRLRAQAVGEGLLSPLKIGETPTVLGNFKDCHQLYLLPNDILEHRLCVRDPIGEEWKNEPQPSPNEKELRDLIVKCEVTPESIQDIYRILCV